MADRVRHRAGTVADFELDRFRIIDLDGRQIGVVRTSAGFFAVRNSCPHASAPICSGRIGGTWLPSAPDERQYGLEGQVVKCPWHGWEFDLRDGGALFGTSGKRLVTYPVDISGDDVLVTVPARGKAEGRR